LTTISRSEVTLPLPGVRLTKRPYQIGAGAVA
jgi:hypothetical protein